MLLWIWYFCVCASWLSYTAVFAADTECPLITSVGDRRKDKTKFRLVQYNVEWLFLDYYSPMDCPGNGCTWHNQSEAQTHMQYVSKVVSELNPDLINLCEVEGCDELNTLSSLIGNNNEYLPYLKKGTDSSTGQNVGMLTRVDPVKSLYRTESKYSYPIPNSGCGYTGNSGTAGVSKHYITEFSINGMSVAFIAAHLLAFPTDPTRCAEREAQASVLQNVVYSFIHNGYEVILLGDFNDFDGEIMDINHNHPTSKVLDILKGMSGDYAGLYSLQSVGELIPENERYSDWWNSDNNCATSSVHDYSVIDHILMTPGIKKYVKTAFMYHGYSEFCGKYNSDHYPVVVDFVFP